MAAGKGTGAKPAARTRRARGSLSREEILDAARTILEQEGLQALSFPRLAKQLNAGATSLYWYFPSKDDLLAGLVDEVTREMYLRLPLIADGPWDQALVDYHVAFRALLRSTAVYREVFAYHAQSLFLGSRMTPHVLHSIEAEIAVLVRAGLTPDEAAEVFNAFSLFTRTFVLMEHAVAQENLDDATLRLIDFSLTQLSDVPTVSALGGIETMVRLDDELYGRGLRLLVAGLRAKYPELQEGSGKKRRGPAKKTAR